MEVKDKDGVAWHRAGIAAGRAQNGSDLAHKTVTIDTEPRMPLARHPPLHCVSAATTALLFSEELTGRTEVHNATVDLYWDRGVCHGRLGSRRVMCYSRVPSGSRCSFKPWRGPVERLG